MQKIPKIAIERLKAAPSVAGNPVPGHPDGNVLTAFAERSLMDRERSTVLAHLARCQDCRDIVALALPEIEAVQIGQTVERPVRAGWFTWPAVRWGAVVAGLVVVGSFGIVEYQHTMRPHAMVAKESVSASLQSQEQRTAAVPSGEKSMPERVLAPAPADKSLTAPAAVAKSDAATSDADSRKEAKVFHGAGALSARAATTSNSIGWPLPGQWQQPQVRGQQSAQKALSELQESSNAPAAAAGQPVAGEITVARNQTMVANQAPTQLFGADESREINRAKPAVTAEASGAPVAVTARWAINSAGSLQRSFDQGNTWQEVSVAASPAPLPAMSYTSVESAAQPAASQNTATQNMTAQKTEAKQRSLDKKSASLPAAPAPVSVPVFRAVTAAGLDVWAGGLSGALYHSLDGGDHWTQVVPFTASATLSGDVVHLEFSDLQHGKITTSTGETWITRDDGVSWQKQ